MEARTRVMQQRLAQPRVRYSYGPYSRVKGERQAIRISEGCPHNCPFCYEPQEFKVFGIPEILRNHVLIYDMNLLAKSQALGIIRELAKVRVNGKVVSYELVCGIDYRFLTQETAQELREARFRDIRIAWDWWYRDQFRIRDAIKMLVKAGYKTGKNTDITIFMICNWRIPYDENVKKLDLCKVWGVKVADCYYDNQVSPNIIPIHWTMEHIKDFRQKVRKHNQIVNFHIDPEVKP